MKLSIKPCSLAVNGKLKSKLLNHSKLTLYECLTFFISPHQNLHVAYAKHLIRYPLIAKVSVEMVQQILHFPWKTTNRPGICL